MTGFANLADAGARLVPAVSDVASGLRDPLLLAIIPNGVPVAEPLAEALAMPLAGAFLDREGEPRELHANGLLATCLQHEIDHLNGVLFIDHISRMKRERVIKKVQKAQQLGKL